MDTFAAAPRTTFIRERSKPSVDFLSCRSAHLLVFPTPKVHCPVHDTTQAEWVAGAEGAREAVWLPWLITVSSHTEHDALAESTHYTNVYVGRLSANTLIHASKRRDTPMMAHSCSQRWKPSQIAVLIFDTQSGSLSSSRPPRQDESDNGYSMSAQTTSSGIDQGRCRTMSDKSDGLSEEAQGYVHMKKDALKTYTP